MFFLPGLAVRPHASALHAVDHNVFIAINEFMEFGWGSRRPFGQDAEAGQGPPQHRQQTVDMGVGVPAAEAEMEPQHVEGGVCLQVIQDEEQLLLVGIEIPVGLATLDVLDFALLDTLLLDGAVGLLERLDQRDELRLGHPNQRSDDAVIGYFTKFVVDHKNYLIRR